MGVKSKNTTSHGIETSFVPKIIKTQFSQYPNWKIGDSIDFDHAAVLWLDICNFSPLCNRLMDDRKEGVEKITRILNKHFDYLLDQITSHGGQPWFFVGDGLMSAWTCEEGDIEEYLLMAITCATQILSNIRSVDDSNNPLSLHCNITQGRWAMTELNGTRNKKLLGFGGEVFERLKLLSTERKPNHILIANDALEKIKTSVEHTRLSAHCSVILSYPEVTLKDSIQGGSLSADAVQNLKAFVPITLSFPINKDRLKWIAEVRPVTNIFVRLRLEGDHSNGADLEKLKSLTELASPIISKRGGLLSQVWKDEKDSNMLICFGPPPSAHQDNPTRAVQLALTLLEAFRESDFRVAMGVGTGKAYCGLLGNELFRQYTTIGDSVNLSARLSDIKYNHVSCGPYTYAVTKHVIDYDGPALHHIKGLDDQVAVYHPKGVLSNQRKTSVIHETIGRDRELEALKDLIEESKLGQNHMVILEGKRGMGKTQLLGDLSRIISTHEEVKHYVITSDIVNKDVPYRLWKNIFADLLGFSNTEPAHLQEDVIKNLELKYQDEATFLNIVLQTSIVENQKYIDLTAAQRIQATHDFLLSILQEASNKNKLVLLIDRAQWMDDSSWQLLHTVLLKLEGVMVVLALLDAETFPYKLTDDESTDLVKYVNLLALDDSTINKILCSSSGLDMVSDELAQLIKKRAKGNPFFSIELLNSLRVQDQITIEDGICKLAKGAVIDNIVLPETVRGAVRMRIDSLTPGSQLSLKVGSIVGDRFSKDIVKNIYPIDSEKNSVPLFLNDARKSGFIKEMTVDNRSGYGFNNITTAEVAYEMTLAEHRRKLHRASAEWYEEKFKEALNPYYVLLAHHWEEANDKIKASEYLELECHKLTSAAYTKEAIEFGIKGLNLFDFEIDQDPAVIEAQIGETFGQIQQIVGDKPIEDFYNIKNIEDPLLERFIVMLTHIAPNMYIGGRIDIFALLALLGLKTSLEHGVSGATADVYSMYAIVYRGVTGDSRTAYEWSKLAMNLDDKFSGKLRSRICHVHGWFLNHWIRPIEETLSISRRGIDSGIEQDDVMFTCFNLSGYVTFMNFAGKHVDEVIRIGQEHYKIADNRVKNAVFHTLLELQYAKALKGTTVAYTVLTDDDFEEQKDLAFVTETDFINQATYYKVGRLKLHTQFGEWSEGLEAVKEVPELYGTIAHQIAEIEYELFGAISALYLAQEDDQEAEKLLAHADASIAKMEGYAALCKENFEQKVMLMKGIKEGLFESYDKALTLLDSAARTAEDHHLLNDKALILEHKLRLQIHHKQSPTGLEDAQAAWKAIGASGKVSYLSTLT